jgi:rare lipoprotein A
VVNEIEPDLCGKAATVGLLGGTYGQSALIPDVPSPYSALIDNFSEHRPLIRRAVSVALCAAVLAASSTAAYAQCGGASWYGPGFHGKRAASGETFNENAMTAAHRSLPFGTKLRVTDQNSGKSIQVVINDRGPFHGKRIIDLSKAAASELGFRNRGVTSVCIEKM